MYVCVQVVLTSWLWLCVAIKDLGVCVCAGSADIMVVEEDALEAQRRIPGSVRINYNAWSHMDFICEWAVTWLRVFWG